MINELFQKCVDLLMYLAHVLNMTYEEVNILIFCIIWPALTIFLFLKAYVLNKKNK